MGVIFVFGACLLWSLDTLIRYPLLGRGISAIEIIFFEHLFLSFFSLWVFLKRPNFLRGLNRKQWALAAFIGGLGSCLGTLFFTHAFSLLNPTQVILLQKLQPLVAIGLARFFLKEPIAPGFLFLGSLSILGATCLSVPDFWALKGQVLSGENKNLALGLAFTLGSVVVWGASTVAGKALSQSRLQSREIMALRFLFGAIFSWPLYFFSNPSNHLGGNLIAQIALLALGAGVLALALYYRGLSLLSARSCAIAELFFPLCAVMVNWIFLGKTLLPLQMIGALVLVLSSLLIQIKKF